MHSSFTTIDVAKSRRSKAQHRYSKHITESVLLFNNLKYHRQIRSVPLVSINIEKLVYTGLTRL
jgi:hypothetical protein